MMTSVQLRQGCMRTPNENGGMLGKLSLQTFILYESGNSLSFVISPQTVICGLFQKRLVLSAQLLQPSWDSSL